MTDIPALPADEPYGTHRARTNDLIADANAKSPRLDALEVRGAVPLLARPGDEAVLWSTTLTGPASERAPAVGVGEVVVNAALGFVLRIRGTDVDPVSGYIDVAPRIDYAVEEGHTYRVSFALARASDPSDPAGHGVETRIQNLSASKAAVSNARLGDVLSPTVAAGALRPSFLIGKAGAPGALAYTIPTTSRYIVPHIRVYGSGQETDLAVIGRIEDVTDGIAGGADIAQKADKAVTVTASGLVTGGGTLGAPINITVLAASLAEAIAGVLTSKAMTPAADKAALDERIAPDVDKVQTLLRDGLGNTYGLFSPALLQMLFMRVSQHATGRLMIGGPDGSVKLLVDEQQAILGPLRVRYSRAGSAGLFLTGIDPDGPIIFGVTHDRMIFGDWVLKRTDSGVVFSTTFSAAEIATYDSRALSISSLTPSRIDGALVQYPFAAYNLVTASGQSFHHGEAAGAALSLSQPHDNKMVGGSIHNGNTTFGSAVWSPIGGAFAMQPLVAANVRAGAVWTNSQVAANLGTYPAGDYLGEAGVVAAANAWRARYLARRGLAADPAHVFVSNGVGRGGTSIVELIPTGSMWGRFTNYCTQMKALADSEVKTVGMSAYLWDQGQADSGVLTKATYKGHLATLLAGVKSVVASTFGQANPPAFLMSQMMGTYTTTDLAISQAQLEFARETPGVYLIGPDYQYTDGISGGHLRANGYRNQGLQYGKVLYRLFELGQSWRPLEPLAIYGRGKEVLVTLHVPAPPIVFDLPYAAAAQVADQANKAFLVTDTVGSNPVLSVSIVGQATLRLVLTRDISGAATLWHARKDTSNGNGFVRDSDAMLPREAYEYIADSGMPAPDNIAALVGKPYSLANWLCGFVEPITLA